MSKKSLVSEAANASESTALIPADAGAVLESITGTAVAVVETTSSTPYVTFVSTKAKRWGDLARDIPGLQDGDAVLVHPKPRPPVRLSPFRFVFLTGLQYWADSDDDDGRLLAVSLENPGRGSDLKENFEALVFALTPGDGLVPARMSLRTTKCGAGKDAVAALAQAETPEWGTLSPAHAQTLRLPKPWMRFVMTTTTTPRTSRSTGYKYVAARSFASPTTANDLAGMRKLFDGDGFALALGAVRDAYEARVAEIREMAGK